MSNEKSPKSLRARINFFVVSILTLAMILSWGYSYIKKYKDVKRHLEEKGSSIARIISGICSYSLLTKDFTLLDEALNKTIEDEDILYIKIIKKDRTCTAPLLSRQK